MSEEDTLEDIFNGPSDEKPPEPEPEKEPEPEPEKEPEKEPEPAASSAAEDVVKGFTAELGRIREQNRELKQQLEAQKPPKEPINLFDDPEGRLKEITSDFDTKLAQTKNQLSETYARRTYEDYDEKLDVFLKMAKENPSYAVQMNAAADPATYAYETAKKQMLLDTVQDVDGLTEKIRAEERKAAEEAVRKELEEKYGQALPDSLADERAAKDNTSVVFDDDLESVVGIDGRSGR